MSKAPKTTPQYRRGPRLSGQQGDRAVDADQEVRGATPELCQLSTGAYDRNARFIAEGGGRAGDGGGLPAASNNGTLPANAGR